jgi:hypothetical protein
MQDNLVFATDSMRSSVNSLRRKLSNLKVSIEQFDLELNNIDSKFDKILTQADIYKAKVEREANRNVRKLEVELEKLRKQVEDNKIYAKENSPDMNDPDLRVASTMTIFDCIIRNICEHGDDFKLMSYAFLFPAVFERVVKADDPGYLRDHVPNSATIIVKRGKEYLQYLREVCDTHLTDQSAWDKHLGEVTNWWKNDALPLFYGEPDDNWQEDVPLSLTEMLSWKEDPASRPFNFPEIFDAFEIMRNNKDAIYKSSGVQELEVKLFTDAE